jgi:heat shock protein HtpX
MLIVAFPFVLPAIVFCITLIPLAAFGYREALSTASSTAIATLVLIVIITIIWLPIAYLTHQRVIDYATGAQPLSRATQRRVWNLLENLCISRGMTMPLLRMIDSGALNAFASGLHDGGYSITLTRGLIDNLTDAELETVLAHELTHIRNRDAQLLVVSTILVGVVPIAQSIFVRSVGTFTGSLLATYRTIFTVLPIPAARMMVTITYNALFFLAKAAAYVIGTIGRLCSVLISLALSRRREFLADAGSVELTKNPDALISAIRKIDGRSGIVSAIDGIREMFFDNPRMPGFEVLFSTHPSIEKRIDAIIRYGRDVAK